MDVTVQVDIETARHLHRRGPATPNANELLHTTTRYRTKLEPLHADTDDPLLSTYFRLEVPDRATAERLLSALEGCRAVAAAYVKPPDEAP